MISTLSIRSIDGIVGTDGIVLTASVVGAIMHGITLGTIRGITDGTMDGIIDGIAHMVGAEASIMAVLLTLHGAEAATIAHQDGEVVTPTIL